MLFNLSRRSGLLIPATSTRFFEEVAPDWILSTVEGTSSLSDNNEIIAWFAFPPVAGAVTRHPMVFRHSLYPAGKESVFAPAVISRAMIVPHRSLKRASEISGMRDPIRKGMLPGINAPGSPVACCRSSPVFKPCRALPVAHPGCPVDHIQTLVNQSPGDLWMRCIGSIHFVFCYLDLGDKVCPSMKLSKK
jgi:hypothetical protein